MATRPVAERLARIELNTEHVIEKIDGMDGKLDKAVEGFHEQGKTVERHSTYFSVIGWALGVVMVLVTAWLSGIGEALMKKAFAGIGG